VAEAGARDLALDLLERVERGAFASRLLEAHLSQVAADRRPLVTELVYGVVRRRGSLEALLAPLMRPEGTRRWPLRARLALWLGAYQLVYLERIPAPAAVDAAVGQVWRAAGPALAGVVNGVLRRLAREGPPPPPAGDGVAALAARGSHPPWLVARWRARYGPEGAAALMAFHNEVPPLTLRVVGGARGAQGLAQALRDAGYAPARGAYLDEVLSLRGAVPADLPALSQGEAVVQDEGAALAGLLLGVEPGERVVDACAGMGTKTVDLLERVGSTGRVWAVDRMAKKLGRLGQRVADRPEAARLTLCPGDARRLPALIGTEVDRVLLDAPCSGLGAARRRPEVRWRRRPEEFRELSELQFALLQAAVAGVRPGGRVLYTTCTLEPEETDGVVDRLLALGGARPEPWGDRLPAPLRALEDPPGRLRLWGPRTGTDGFFYALLRRRGDAPARGE
jgi:16S rRNA (cytosine967-C5)-methyltransferase